PLPPPPAPVPVPQPVPVPAPVPQPVPVPPVPAPVPNPVPNPPRPTIANPPCIFVDGDVLTLQADSGKYLDRCNNCVPGGAYPDSSTVHVTTPASESWGTWKVFNVGNGKLALQGDAGKYLARCNGCAPGAAYPDQAFVHVSDWRGQGWAQWTCYDVGGGKIALQADSGKYLARCNGCIPGAAYVDQAFVHATDWRGTPWAQWAVVNLTPHYAPAPLPLPPPPAPPAPSPSKESC
ncbi:hypothetical protein As57867_002910, partial [Aphanomyces stellatus]